MTTIAVVQARMGSTRLPGKVLMDLGGRPALVLMLDRLSPALVNGLDRLVVATSTLANDDPVAQTAQQAGFDVVRGSERDVLARFVSALDAYPADTVVRLTADCPLADPTIVIQALASHVASGADYTSNTLIRTFPDGLDVEVVAADALRAAASEAQDPAEREHVTPFIYRRPERFVLRAFRSGADLGDERWTVDTAEDLADIGHVIDGLDSPTTASWRDVLAMTGRSRPPAAGQLWLRPFDPADQPRLAELGRAAPDRLVDQPDDVATRTWTAEVDAVPRGWISVAVHEGIGRAQWSLADGDLAPVRHLLDARLAADRQVVTLVEG